jgi:hypothetical protein
MGIDEMLALFIGFVIATILIWATSVFSRSQKTAAHKQKQTKQKADNQCKRSDEKNQPWNVSTFFH